MKVTVCFGSIRVLVPCGTGDLLVRDLINEATRRYKKASGKDNDSWVTVHHLQSQSGILDPDDRVNDVADDREQIIASFEDSGPDPGVPQGGGDGASGSSVGTSSPDIFQSLHTGDPKYEINSSNITDIEVTVSNQHMPNGLTVGGLQVRRSSDPSVHQNATDSNGVSGKHPPPPVPHPSDRTKRWSAAPVCRNDESEHIFSESNRSGNGVSGRHYLSPPVEMNGDQHNNSLSPLNSFTRSGRLSMQFMGDGNGYKWMDAAEKIASSYSSRSLPRDPMKRKEPLGQAYESMREKNTDFLLVINNSGGPLGLTAIPDPENGCILVQHVEANSEAARGRLKRGDRIVEINDVILNGLSEESLQQQLRNSCKMLPELRLRVVRPNLMVRQLQREIADLIESDQKPSKTKIATVSPTRKLAGAPVALSLQLANTRKLGRRIEISLRKGVYGLGFSVTTRDNPAGGHCPIYIKTILPRGAAIEDGRLKPGDRLLEVDGVPMTGKSQSDVVGILRATQQGATVRIIVSRQTELGDGGGETEINELEEDNLTKPKPPPIPILPQRSQDQMQNTAAIPSTSSHSLTDTQVFPWRNREILTLHIPVYDSEKAGLGVSVKGKTGSNNSSGESSSSQLDGDLGIFVKSVLHGGAASRDGRLKTNDQLLNVNGISLLGQSNADAMETLRKAMLHNGNKYPGIITLTVSRRISKSTNYNHSHNISVTDTSDPSTSVSSTSEQSGKTVIYLNSDEKIDHSGEGPLNKRLNGSDGSRNRYSNPVLDRLTGGMVNNEPNVCLSPPNHERYQSQPVHGLRNESYYMATNETWNPRLSGLNGNNSVLIEEDPEPPSPGIQSSTSNECASKMTDITYASQLSLETNPPNDAFSRDAIGRRSMSEKHHAALDAKETGTYQRNKKLREERERRGRNGKQMIGSSMESLTNIGHGNDGRLIDLEARDRIGDLGPSLGLKKSSSLESLQTMVQEIQMSDEPRGPATLRSPRGRGHPDSLRAAVENKPKTRKHWLVEEGPSDTEGGFINRHGPFQSSLNEGKRKQQSTTKKPGLLKGIGHMFRFGKHRKDHVQPIDIHSDIGSRDAYGSNQMYQKITMYSDRLTDGPPTYQPPPPVVSTGPSKGVNDMGNNGGIHQNDIFNHRYSHYVNYEDIQNHVSSQSERLSESTIAQMRHQVMQQRVKVENESRRNQHYHSQRSLRSNVESHPATVQNHQPHHLQKQQQQQQRPASSYYEYETVRPEMQTKPPPPPLTVRKLSGHSTNSQWTNGSGSGRNRGPFVTQVTIQPNTSTKRPPFNKPYPVGGPVNSSVPPASKV